MQLVYFKNEFFSIGRILCLTWDSSGNHIVTGSIDTVRIWNVNTGHAIHKMTTGRAISNRETIVWCLAVTDDFTIISGDSRFAITVYFFKWIREEPNFFFSFVFQLIYIKLFGNITSAIHRLL